MWINSVVAAKVEMLGANPATDLCGQEHQGGPKPLAPQAKAVLRQPIDKGIIAGKLPLQQAFDGFEVSCRRRIQSTEILGNLCSLSPVESMKALSG